MGTIPDSMGGIFEMLKEAALTMQQGGGIGAKGEGESQLEQDKRKIRLQIDRLKRELTEVRSARATQRKDRKRAPVPNAAIVGYTNVGKSSLLRRLTGADVFVEDKLFATLDTKGREADFVRGLLTSWDVAVTLVDVGALGTPAATADVSLT